MTAPADMTTADLLDAFDHLGESRSLPLDAVAELRTRQWERDVCAEVSRRLRHAILIDSDTDAAERNRPSATSTIEHAKLYLRAHWSQGVACPACGRNVRLYSEKLSSNMARALIAQYRAAGTDMVDTRDIWPSNGTSGPKAPQLKHWRIIESGAAPRLWRITDLGVGWLAGRVMVPSHAYTFNDKCYGHSATLITLADALGEPFDLGELMAARPFPPPSDPSPQLFST